MPAYVFFKYFPSQLRCFTRPCHISVRPCATSAIRHFIWASVEVARNVKRFGNVTNPAIVAEAFVCDLSPSGQNEVKSQNCSNSKEEPDGTSVVGTLCIGLVRTGPFAPNTRYYAGA